MQLGRDSDVEINDDDDNDNEDDNNKDNNRDDDDDGNDDDNNNNNNNVTKIANIEFFLAGDLQFCHFLPNLNYHKTKNFWAPSCREETPDGLWHWASTEISTVKVKDNS